MVSRIAEQILNARQDLKVLASMVNDESLSEQQRAACLLGHFACLYSMQPTVFAQFNEFLINFPPPMTEDQEYFLKHVVGIDDEEEDLEEE